MEKVQLAGGGILLRTYEMKDVEQLHSAASRIFGRAFTMDAVVSQ